MFTFLCENKIRSSGEASETGGRWFCVPLGFGVVRVGGGGVAVGVVRVVDAGEDGAGNGRIFGFRLSTR